MCKEPSLSFDAMDTSYFLGRETVIPQTNQEMASWRKKLFFRKAGSPKAHFQLPSNRVVELGCA